MNRVVRSLAAFFLFAGMASAQVLYGSLTGNVIDPANAPVPGVPVEALNMSTNVKSETTTDDRGVYRFTELQAGLYQVTVTANRSAPSSKPTCRCR